MSLAQAPLPDRGASPLMSNNPFRNRIASSTPRPISTNPFLDTAELPPQQPAATIKTVPSGVVDKAADIFGSLSVSERAASPTKNYHHTNSTFRRPEPGASRPVTRGNGHRTTSSDEERRKQQMGRAPTELDIFADPVETKPSSRERRQPRRNSESSVIDKSRPLDEDEEKRRERKRRESKRPGTTKGKPSRKLDVIDKLDVTSIYGTGLFHHDGPFDACNPNRNRRRHKFAPMQAFPKDSDNMRIGGSGPVNNKLDYDKFHGYSQEAHLDFHGPRNGSAIVDGDAAYVSRPVADRSTSFNATSRIDPVHGAETAGLGTSTFLEGAPASRAAIERRDSEFERQQGGLPGLSRKKSLAQKIRAVRPGARIAPTEAERQPTSPLATTQSESAVNPFFKDYDNEYDRKGAQIAATEELNTADNAKASTSPKAAPILERTATNGSGDAPQPESKPMGLLGRMKSLKKPRSRSERREAS